MITLAYKETSVKAHNGLMCILGLCFLGPKWAYMHLRVEDMHDPVVL